MKIYEWIDKYINGSNDTPFIEFIFDEISPKSKENNIIIKQRKTRHKKEIVV